MEKICNIMSNCKYSIHDLSRVELDENTNLPRFNMPFELGLDYGCKKFGKSQQKRKVLLILEKERYQYQKLISDLSGVEVYAHYNNTRDLIKEIRNWICANNTSDELLVNSASKIFEKYNSFLKQLPKICNKQGTDPQDLHFKDFRNYVVIWLDEREKLKKEKLNSKSLKTI